VPFSFQIYAEANPNAYGNVSSNPGFLRADGGGSSDLGGRGVRLEFGPVMTLPAGYTLNSPSWGIVNNTYPNLVAVGETAPAPGSIHLELTGANPSPGAFHLALDLPQAGMVAVGVSDLSGRRIRSLVAGWRPSGRIAMVWMAWTSTAAPPRRGSTSFAPRPRSAAPSGDSFACIEPDTLAHSRGAPL
jgi:hypothetical protein